MECISKNVKGNNSDILSNYSQDKSVTIRDDIKEFLKKNSGGYPKKDIVSFNGEEYEVRVFLSLDESDDNYYIEKPLFYFTEKTRGKIIPIGIDSGDNYYCVNNDSGKVYYWSSSEDKYYYLACSLEEFMDAFE